jgi:putative hydroxymethylpyrimidine transport system ATP-binding protein
MRADAPALTLDGTARIGGLHIFGPLRLKVAAGRITCLLGPSGVGKTTLLRLLAGVDDVTDFSGTITASDGLPLAGRMALMAQGDLLMPWLDVLGNVTLGARLRGARRDRDRATAMLGRVGLTDHARKRPHALSGGQKQRVALARTLMEDRPVILLDEPFSALDARTRTQMQDLAAEHLAGRTVLMVTHDPAEAARMGHVIRILTETGLEQVSPPPGPVPRPVDDPDTLTAQGRLLSRLRAPANQE